MDGEQNGTTSTATLPVLDSMDVAGSDNVGGFAQASTIVAEEGAAEYDIQKKLEKSKIKERLFRKPPAPMRVGRFVVLDKLGAGAMGEVYAAYDEQLDRKVALKLVRPELAAKSQKASQRLIREAKTQARLSHPNVVQVYEAGMFQGRVFLAMEFIRGQNLQEWLEDLTDAPASERWRLVCDKFIDAGKGLQAAHAAGLVHRDFKPGNVLVGGEDGRVCVADFGLARRVEDVRERGEPAEIDAREAATADPDRPVAAPVDRQVDGRGDRRAVVMPTDGGLATARGAIVGTPAYMAPEQFEGLPADARSDQYSFCVALYEALYGRRPHDADNFWDLRDSVLSDSAPALPRLSPVPTRVRRAIARGLQRKPDERFADMQGLLDALSGTGHRRRWLGLAAAGALAAVLVASVAVLSVGGERAQPCAGAGDSARALWDEDVAAGVEAAFAATGSPRQAGMFALVQRSIEAYLDGLANERMYTCEATHVRGEQSQELFTLTTLCIDRRQRHLEATLALFASADALTVEKAPQVLTGLPAVSVCREREALKLGTTEPDDPERAKLASDIRVQLDKAHVQWLSGHLKVAETMMQAQLARAEEIDHPPSYAEALFHLGALRLHDDSDADAVARAEANLLDAVDLAEAHRSDRLAGDIWLQLALLALRHHSDLARGHLYARRVMAAAERINSNWSRSQALQVRGSLFAYDREYVRAEEFLKRALEILPAETNAAIASALIWHDLGHALAQQHGKHEEAEQAYRLSIQLMTDRLGAGNLYVARAKLDYGILQHEAGHFDDARRLLREARGAFESLYGAAHRDVARCDVALANLEQEAGGLEAAEGHALRVRDTYGAIFSADDARHAKPEILLAIIQFRRNRFADAAASFERALQIQRRVLAPGDVLIAETLSNLGETLVQLERCDEALQHLVEADAIYQRNPQKYPLLGMWIPKNRGMAYLCLGEFHAAREMLEPTLARLRERAGDPLERAAVLWALARTRRQLGEWPDAETSALAEEARQIFLASGEAGAQTARDIATWLSSE